MKITATISKQLLKRKLVTALFIGASIAAFAALGDGGKKNHASLPSTTTFSSRNFSLRSGYNYRSNNLFNKPNTQSFILLNTVVTIQKGNATYVLPLKKKVLLDKIKINPAPSRY
jgi:spermidine/putrescine-binding protein